ncbi:MAG: hypothetical protein SO003_02380 [Candidatus Borkfalkiaceae bacterium]|nr:hypothetical protein [Christensenellaceae bacterium]
MNEFAKRKNYQTPEISFLILSDEDVVTKSVGVDYSSMPWIGNGVSGFGDGNDGGAKI